MKNTIHGVLVDHQIGQLIRDGILEGANMDRIQPSSIDIELDLNTLMNIKHFTLPRRGECIESLIKTMRYQGVAKDAKNLLLNIKEHYLVRLKTSCNQIPCFTRANPKSSIGRIFVHSRLVCDRSTAIDEVPVGHTGDLWMFINPKFFLTVLHESEPLNQLRFFYGDARLSADELRRQLCYFPELVQIPEEENEGQSTSVEVLGDAIGEIPVSVDLKGNCYRTRKTDRPLGLNERDIPFEEYYELIDPASMKDGLVLEEGYGYIIGTTERFQIPNNMAFEVVASDRWGEFQPDFAGFGDIGFGFRKPTMNVKTIGNSVTLEIIVYERGLCIRHGQYVAAVRMEWSAAIPDNIYQGNYTFQQRGGKLPKFVK